MTSDRKEWKLLEQGINIQPDKDYECGVLITLKNVSTDKLRFYFVFTSLLLFGKITKEVIRRMPNGSLLDTTT